MSSLPKEIKTKRKLCLLREMQVKCRCNAPLSLQSNGLFGIVRYGWVLASIWLRSGLLLQASLAKDHQWGLRTHFHCLRRPSSSLPAMACGWSCGQAPNQTAVSLQPSKRLSFLCLPGTKCICKATEKVYKELRRKVPWPSQKKNCQKLATTPTWPSAALHLIPSSTAMQLPL